MAESGTANRAEAALRLRAEDVDDMAVIAACLQDAVVVRGDMTYLPKPRRFAMVLSRYCWEEELPAGAKASPRKGRGRRTRTGVHFDGVMKVETLGFPHDEPAAALSLLTIAVEPSEAGATVLLLFAGGPMVRLAVECIDCRLADIGPSWETPRQPRHPLVDDGTRRSSP